MVELLITLLKISELDIYLEIKELNVKKYDHVVSSDLDYWLDYVNMKEDFWKTANTFRDKRVWKKVKSEWVKKNLWD